MSDLIREFREYREKMNKKILAHDNKVMKRILWEVLLLYLIPGGPLNSGNYCVKSEK
jgi:hypothetical protein